MEQSQQLIRDAEANKVGLFPTKGNTNANFDWALAPVSQSSVRASDVDENYLVIGVHVDAAIQMKIVQHEYVDFSKLLPCGRFSKGDDDNRLELVSKGGLTYFMPVSDRENASINSFGKWEQAYHVFSNIYTRAHPSKATELIQYNHIIHYASTSFIWENVYMYDREFHMHMSHYPSHSWAIILQQAWSMYLKDRLPPKGEHSPNTSNTANRSPGSGKIKEPCRRFNQGKYNRGAACHYEHRCTVPECGKYGHGAHICRKRKNNKNAGNDRASNNRTQMS